MRDGPAAAFVVFGLLLMASCGLSPDRGDVAEKDGHFVLVAPEEISEAGVGFPVATVRLVGDCVGLDVGTPSGRAVVIWPHGSDFVSVDPIAIDVPGVGRVAVGDELEGGGAEYDAESPLPGIEVPDGCLGVPVISFTPDQ